MLLLGRPIAKLSSSLPFRRFRFPSVLPRRFPFRTAHAYRACAAHDSAPLAYQPLKRNWIAHLSTAESEASRREVFTQPQRQAYCAQHFWLEPPRMSSGNFDVSCVQTALYRKALFTTLNITCAFESRQRWLDGILILPFLLGITTNIAN